MRLEITCCKCGERVHIKSAGRRVAGHATQLMEDENGNVLIGNVCHQCRLKYQRELRRRGTYERVQKRYEKTIGGVLIRRLQSVREWGWSIAKDEFYRWARTDDEFMLVYIEWRDSGYCAKLAPCVIIINLSQPPSLINCAWVPYMVKRGLNLMEIRSGRSAAPTRRRHRTP